MVFQEIRLTKKEFLYKLGVLGVGILLAMCGRETVAPKKQTQTLIIEPWKKYFITDGSNIKTLGSYVEVTQLMDGKYKFNTIMVTVDGQLVCRFIEKDGLYAAEEPGKKCYVLGADNKMRVELETGWEVIAIDDPKLGVKD